MCSIVGLSTEHDCVRVFCIRLVGSSASGAFSAYSALITSQSDSVCIQPKSSDGGILAGTDRR